MTTNPLIILSFLNKIVMITNQERGCSHYEDLVVYSISHFISCHLFLSFIRFNASISSIYYYSSSRALVLFSPSPPLSQKKVPRFLLTKPAELFQCLGIYKILSCGYICLKERPPAPRHSRHKQSALRKGRPPSSGRFAYAFRVYQGACAFDLFHFLF
ncbi:hypothetical protein J2Z58_001258 [Halobacillus andaensis]|nr:hypothetical protein [Halobacillus andaensis]